MLFYISSLSAKIFARELSSERGLRVASMEANTYMKTRVYVYDGGLIGEGFHFKFFSGRTFDIRLHHEALAQC